MKEGEALAMMEKCFRKGTISSEALAMLQELQQRLDAFDFVGAEEVYKRMSMDFFKLHKEWMLPLKHFLGVCKKMSS